MADKKYTQFTELNEQPNDEDLFLLVDTSDTTGSPEGTTKKIKYQNVKSTGGTGDVTGPASSTAGTIPVYGDSTGKLIDNSGVAFTNDLSQGTTEYITTNEGIRTYIDNNAGVKAFEPETINPGNIAFFNTNDGIAVQDNEYGVINDPTMDLNSEYLLPTEHAVKTYVDNGLAGKQDSIGFNPEDVANKSDDTTLALDSSTLYPTEHAVKTYVDNGLSTKENTLGFTPEDSANKDTDGTFASADDTKYPTSLAVKTYVDNSEIAGQVVYDYILGPGGDFATMAEALATNLQDKIVLVRNGDYQVSGPTVSNWVRTTWVGDGTASIYVTDNYLQFTEQQTFQNITLRIDSNGYFQFDGNDTVIRDSKILISQDGYIILNGQNSRLAGNQLLLGRYGAAGTETIRLSANNIAVEGNRFEIWNGPTSGNRTLSAQAQHAQIQNNIFEIVAGSATDGYFVEATNYYAQIQNNAFMDQPNNTMRGVKITNERATVSGNSFRYLTQGVQLTNDGMSKVVGNDFYVVGDIPGAGVDLIGTDNSNYGRTLISNNTYRNPGSSTAGSSAIRITQTYNAVVATNTIKDCYVGVSLESSTNDCQVYGNDITATSTEIDDAGTGNQIGFGGGGSGDVVGPASAINGAIAIYGDTTGKLLSDSTIAISTDGTLSSDSDTLVPTEKAVKTYVDTNATGQTLYDFVIDAGGNGDYTSFDDFFAANPNPDNKTIFVRSGDYQPTSHLAITATNVTFIGEDRIGVTFTTNDYYFEKYGNSWRVENMTFICNTTDGNGYIYIDGSTNDWVNCKFECNTNNANIYFNNDQNTFDRCEFYGANQAATQFQFQGIKNTIINSQILLGAGSSTASTGMVFGSKGNFVQNTIFQLLKTGASASDASVAFNGMENRFMGNDIIAMDETEPDSPAIAFYEKYNTIIGNNFTAGNTVSKKALLIRGDYGSGECGTKIIGNKFENFKHAIYATVDGGLIISNNHFEIDNASNYPGVNVHCDVDNVSWGAMIISDNYSNSNGSSGGSSAYYLNNTWSAILHGNTSYGPSVGIELGATAEDCRVYGNSVDGNTNDIVDNGINNFVGQDGSYTIGSNTIDVKTGFIYAIS